MELCSCENRLALPRQAAKRSFQIDNIKAILICCVVVGHLCEVFSFRGSTLLYLFIYSFHMPAFALLSGVCCGEEYQPRKILTKYIYPYLLFQTAYFVFSVEVLHQTGRLQFLKPYWILWYLLALIVWQVALPFFRTRSRKAQAVLLLGAVAVALYAGYNTSISYFLSLSRILVFFPFFLAGYYFSDFFKSPFQAMRPGVQKAARCIGKGAAVALTVLVLLLLYWHRAEIRPAWFYQAQPYSKLDYSPLFRALSFLCAAVLIALLFLFVPNCPLRFFTGAGQHTMPIFLLHGFVVLYLKHCAVAQGIAHPAVAVGLLTTAMLAIFSSKPVVSLLRPLMQCPVGGQRAPGQ